MGSMAQTPAAAPVLDLSAQYLDSKTTSHCYSQQQAKYFLPTVPVIAGEFSSWQQLAHKCRSDLQARQDLVNTTKTKLQILVGKPDPCQLKVLSAQLANEAASAAALALLCQGRVEKEILTAMKKKSDAQAWV